MVRIICIGAAAIAAFLFAGACSGQTKPAQDAKRTETAAVEGAAAAVFAGGCFWCVESDFEKLDGVITAVSGYAGGEMRNPTYRNHGRHIEAVEVTYDPAVVSYAELVAYFLRHIDPLDAGGQFCDRGHAYTTAIFVANAEERRLAEAAIVAGEEEVGQRFVTPVIERTSFWDAEEYHQDYYKKNPLRYRLYRTNCGRDQRIAAIWNKPS